MKSVRSFLSDSNAAVALLFGVALLPVMGLAGVAVDYATARDVQRYLQATVDSAALAGAAAIKEPEGQIKKIVKDSFGTNVAGIPFELTPSNPKIVPTGSQVEVEASVAVPTTLSKLLGINEMSVSARAVAGNAGVDPVEIVFVIDITESMGFNGAWEKARTEMDKMLDEIKKAAEDGDDVIMGLVPFSDRVNVGVARAENWITGKAPKDFQGCLEPRVESEIDFPHMESAASPSDIVFTPTTPKNFGIFRTVRGWNWATAGCLDSPIVGPTTDVKDLRTAFQKIKKGGTGRAEQGLLWAWRMLSPDWAGQWGMANFPAAKGEKRKVVGLIVDGRSEGYYWEMGGSKGNPPAGEKYVNNSPTAYAMKHFQEICKRMKGDGVEIHVFYVNGEARGKDYYKACASDENTMYSADNMQSLTDAFSSMKLSLSGGSGPRLVE
ncbi:Tad domain-containing protein [Futiania mangrovi]|uniref:Pilus assembly protein TadG-related protein n=1 Tax=Futiania mangrovi TaxID=2959716 RepID=A0A9J6PDZ1_9PROT|nr:Tad domain-containing protein [Futiania mangrovii]MCP1337621.1 pilus assembly protein TadG-related protein [Futiania mangrovii]